MTPRKTSLRHPLCAALAAAALVAAWTVATAQTHQHQQAAEPDKGG